jgi:hypothetical protein
MVRTLGVVEDQPVGQFAVKERKVSKEQLLVAVDEGKRPCSRALAVCRACLEGSPRAKAKCETGSMKVTM